MSEDRLLDRVHKLLALATGSVGGEEARTAAVVAARLIVQHNLIQAPSVEPRVIEVREPGMREHEELRPLIRELLKVFLDLAWQERKNDSLVTVPLVIDWAIDQELLRQSERERAMGMLGNLVHQERKRGVVVSIRGRYGGYRMAPGVRRGRAPA